MTRHSIDALELSEKVHDPKPGHESAASHRDALDVLVVDDEAAVRLFLTRCLEQWGYAVRQAASAEDALDMMVSRPASLVLCDIRLPGHDGLWLAGRLHARWPGTPFVMTSAIDDVETIRQTRELGAADYVTKPILPDQLREVIRRVMPAVPADETQQVSDASSPGSYSGSGGEKIDAEYTLESPVRCPACGERITTLKAIRLVRTHVNFISTLPRRGRVIACPHCLAVIPGELTNF